MARSGGPIRKVAPAGGSGPGAWLHALAFLIVLGLWLVGAAAAAATFEARGRVAAVDPTRGAVTLEHTGIAGLLPATRSEFPVATAGLLEGVRIGDRVRFTLTAADESHGLLTVANLTPEGAGSATWPDRLMVIAAAVLALAALAGVAVAGVLLRRAFHALDRRVVALDHETAMLRGDVADTQDGIRQLARALEDAVTILRVGYVRELRRRLATAPTGSAPEGSASSDPDRSLIVVQRGRGDLYQAVASGAVGPGCTAMWDRRRGERRSGGRHAAAPERRKAERRASLPESWTRLGFHIVPGAHGEAPRGVRPLHPAGGERGAAR